MTNKIGGGLFLLIVLGLIGLGLLEDTQPPPIPPTPSPTITLIPTNTPKPTNTLRPTSTPLLEPSKTTFPLWLTPTQEIWN